MGDVDEVMRGVFPAAAMVQKVATARLNYLSIYEDFAEYVLGLKVICELVTSLTIVVRSAG